MAQRLLIDRPARLAYLGLALAGLACGGAPGSVVPATAGPVPSAQVAEWVRGTQPQSHRLHRFKWLFRDDKASAGGRGSARIAPPDSMRFDVAGPFGSGAASAAVIGEQPLWAEPPDAVSKMVPNYPLMWGMFGVARPPSAGAELRGLSEALGRRHRAGKLGAAEEVLVDKVAESQVSGYSRDYTRYYLAAGTAGAGEILTARAEDLHADGLAGARAA